MGQEPANSAQIRLLISGSLWFKDLGFRVLPEALKTVDP